MATSVAQREDALAIPDERRHAIAAAIAHLQAEGAALTNDNVLKLVGGGRTFVVRYMKAWRAQQRTDVPAVDASPAPAAGPAPVPRPGRVSRLEELRQLCAEDDEAWRDLERETQQLQQDRAEHWSALRQALTEAQRLLPLLHRAQQASRVALYAGHAGVQEEAQRLRQALAALVGTEEVRMLVTDPHYVPAWVTAR